MSTRDLHIAVYGDLNLNIIDGSAIWLQSLCCVLSETKRARVTVVLKASDERSLLTGHLRSLPNVRVLCPATPTESGESHLTHEQALTILEELDVKESFDALIFRGYKFCLAAATRSGEPFAGRMYPYLTDIPQYAADLTSEHKKRVQAIASAAKFLFCQTEALRCYMESNISGVAGKAMLLPPMIPDSITANRTTIGALAEDEPLRLVYVGKFAPDWYTLEMIRAVDALRRQGLNVELHMVGDKIHRDRKHPAFYDEMKQALEATEGVVWHGGKSRQETLDILGEYHVALGWRHLDLDDSLELSTKLLEYGAVGLPVILNRNPMHEDLLGSDYPLFANTAEEFKQAVTEARDETIRMRASQRGQEAAQPYRFSSVATLMNQYLDRAIPLNDLRSARRPNLRVLVACHDFKFFTRIQEHLSSIRGIDVREDVWPAINEHDEAQSKELLAWADVVICEWFANNAIWYSKHKREGQRLIVRLHRFELYGQYPIRANFANVDHVVFVGDYYKNEAISRLNWDASKLEVIPNWVDDKLMNRSKVPGACFNLGMIGIAPMRKRLDRGLDILESLRKRDSRFQLYIKSKLPWEYPWIWAKPEEQEHYRQVFRRINEAPYLRAAVHFDPFGPEVGAWLRKIGFVLSTSDDESFHLSPAEGMASGALPMLLDWQGVEALYPDKWIHSSCDEIVQTILNTLDSGDWSPLGDEVKEFIGTNYSIGRVCQDWERLVTRDFVGLED